MQLPKTMKYNMEFLNPHKQTGIQAGTGKLLIAEPMLGDPSFSRSVVLICEHGPEGTVGFSLNRPTEHTLGDLLPELYTPLLPVFQGGPVQLDTLHMLHRTPLAFGGTEVADGIYWGGSYEALQEAVLHNSYQPIDLRLFVGYSGWGAGQLEKELEEGSWLVANVTPELIFETDPELLWRRAIESLGDDFAYLINMPVNPQLN
jgi:putative transcriptional regulator